MLPNLDETFEGQLLLYAVASKPNVFKPVLGLSEHSLCWIEREGYGVIVSPTTLQVIRPQKLYLQAYNRAISSLISDGSILPFTFGSIAESRAALVKTLTRGESRLKTSLDLVSGAVEMGVRVIIECRY